MIFVARTESGETVEYRDTKRWLWILSVLSPAVPMAAVYFMLDSGNPLWAMAPLIFYYVAVPLLDALFGEDNDNPPDAVIEALASDNYYRVLLFLSIPVFYGSFLASMYAAMQASTPWWAMLALAWSAGVASGAGITVGHELGHKPNRLDQWGAKAILALTGYGHFPIEHNRGHHVMVATPEDPASARLGESVYRFALREIPGAAQRAIALERERLARKGLPFWHWRNDILQSGAITLVIAVVLTAWLGPMVLLLLAIHHLVGWLQLTFANYVEHYGLLREKRPDGRYMPCEPRHSWNTNHIVSNLMLFHLQRHSDHHANPLRPYQTLRNFDDLPRLPSGYPGCYVLAVMPPAWFHVMDPKVLAWAGGDLSRTNHVPGYRPGHRP